MRILRIYQVLPFGLATAPRVFTKLLAPLAAFLHFRTMSMFPYIDNIFHAQASASSAERTRDTSVLLHLRLSFMINLAKSSLIPSQVMTHLGDLIDILTGIVSPTPDKDREISRLSQSKTPPAGSGYLHGLPCRGPFVPVSDQTDFGLPHTELQTEQGQPYEEDLSSGSRGSGGLSFLGGPK